MDRQISVIIPVKNRANLLRITLQNILKQTVKPFEIIVVDDHSTDNLADLIVDFQDSVSFLESEGNGPGAARNKGLAFAKGNIIQFFDSDDLMTLNKLEAQSDLLISGQYDFVYGPFVKASQYEDGDWKQTDVIMQYEPLPTKQLTAYVLEGWCNIFQSAMFRKDFLDRVGPWREDLTTHEDYEYWFRIAKASQRFAHENKSCVIYRQHLNQITDKDRSDQIRWEEGLLAMQKIREGIDFRPSLQSLIIFKGRSCYSKLNYMKKFGRSPNSDYSLSDYLAVPLFKISNKLNRILTKSNWQLMHGVSRSETLFSQYLKSVRY